MARCKYLSKKHPQAGGLGQCASFSASGSIAGMKKLYYGKDALLVRSGNVIYNVTPFPHLYHLAK